MEGLPRVGNNAERAFHENRWEEEADVAGKPFFGEKHTAEDIMRKEAEADHADFENRQHAEFEAWQHNLARVKEGFLDRASNPESKRKTLIMMMGGGDACCLYRWASYWS